MRTRTSETAIAVLAALALATAPMAGASPVRTGTVRIEVSEGGLCPSVATKRHVNRRRRTAKHPRHRPGAGHRHRGGRTRRTAHARPCAVPRAPATSILSANPLSPAAMQTPAAAHLASLEGPHVTPGESPPPGTSGAPADLSAPTIAGTTAVGRELAADAGSWSGAPTSYGYQWERCDARGASCAPLPGLNSTSYLITAPDVGTTLRVNVTAYNPAGHSSASSAPSEVVTGGPGAPAHVMVVVEENRDRSAVIGAPDMPYLNSLAARYGNTTDWNGVGHPSLPNYLALISGSTQGVSDDACGHSFTGTPTLASELSAAAIPWKAYLEELPQPASEACTSGGYAKKHNPFAYFPETNGPKVVPASQFQTDEALGQLSDFIFYVPNLTNDGHDGTNEQVDAYLKGLIAPVLASSWYQEGGVIIITWDESNGEGKVPTVVIAGEGSGAVVTAAGNHYGTLATIEDLYGVPRLGNAAGAATLAALLK